MLSSRPLRLGHSVRTVMGATSSAYRHGLAGMGLRSGAHAGAHAVQESGDPSALFAPITDVPYPRIDLRKLPDPVPAILDAPEFAETTKYFAQSPCARRSLLSDVSRALLYTLIRNLRPAHVVEIGTYRGGTAESLSRALQANDQGTLHTVSPYDAERFGPIFAQWPEELRRRTRYYPVDSMMFFMQIDQERIQPDLVLVDGHHDYEFANFDIQASARRLTPGGFILIDNVSQAGPFRAAEDFLGSHPGWRDCGVTFAPPDKAKAFDGNRSRIPGADFYVLRAPFAYLIGQAPLTFGVLPWNEGQVQGLRLSLAKPRRVGTLHIQCILRAFSEVRIEELVGHASRVIDGSADQVDIAFPEPIMAEGTFDRYSVEPWLIWQGDTPLPLAALPVPY
jgi:predicted O-methyltransferase YrrM